MKSRNTLFVIIASAFLLAACGQTGQLVMPKTYPTKRPPPPKNPKLIPPEPPATPQAPQQDTATPETPANDTDKTDQKD